MTDDKLVGMMCGMLNPDFHLEYGSTGGIARRKQMHRVLTRIRPHLEACGIEIAAEKLEITAQIAVLLDPENPTGYALGENVNSLRALARQHAIGESGK